MLIMVVVVVIRHLCEDEEIWFVLGGAGHFNVWDKQDQWISITVEVGDLIIFVRRCGGSSSHLMKWSAK